MFVEVPTYPKPLIIIARGKLPDCPTTHSPATKHRYAKLFLPFETLVKPFNSVQPGRHITSMLYTWLGLYNWSWKEWETFNIVTWGGGEVDREDVPDIYPVQNQLSPSQGTGYVSSKIRNLVVIQTRLGEMCKPRSRWTCGILCQEISEG